MFGQNEDDQNQPYQDNNVTAPPVTNPAPPSDFMNPGFTPPQPPAPAPESLEDSAPVLADPDPTDFTAPSTPADGLAPAADTPVTDASDNLLNMKQAALQELTPLVQHLDQSPEEKFRTVMMMIQAADDQTKLGEAFTAAKQITDDKVRAQALLDVINEINYFSQQHKS